MTPPTITVAEYVVTLSGLPPGAVVGWGDSRESVADSNGTAQHDYDSPEATADRFMPRTTMPGRRGLVVTLPDNSDRWAGHVDVACVSDAW
jgi:hypothetical protein